MQESGNCAAHVDACEAGVKRPLRVSLPYHVPTTTIVAVALGWYRRNAVSVSTIGISQEVPRRRSAAGEHRAQSTGARKLPLNSRRVKRLDKGRGADLGRYRAEADDATGWG